MGQDDDGGLFVFKRDDYERLVIQSKRRKRMHIDRPYSLIRNKILQALTMTTR